MAPYQFYEFWIHNDILFTLLIKIQFQISAKKVARVSIAICIISSTLHISTPTYGHIKIKRSAISNANNWYLISFTTHSMLRELKKKKCKYIQ